MTRQATEQDTAPGSKSTSASTEVSVQVKWSPILVNNARPPSSLQEHSILLFSTQAVTLSVLRCSLLWLPTTHSSACLPNSDHFSSSLLSRQRCQRQTHLGFPRMHLECIPLLGLPCPPSPPHQEDLGTFCDCGTFLVTELLLCPGPGTYPILAELPTSLGGPSDHPIRSRAHREVKVVSVSQNNERLNCGPLPPCEASARALSPSSGPFVC